ncbi:hypothetical protein A4A49_51122 [Nicotiana attenuata]|uniref:Uncharacterized protein n=1 Tax=Nicotiana attenuata TaxID=49451 RepID=A0A1J6IJ45_NICAT|nr:hypothetical protein A4A49_51122 [Nicotiana attenuata]
MVGTPINSHKLPFNKSANIKFLSSYGGKILPCHSDGKLRYYGGDTRVLSVHRSISFAGKLPISSSFIQVADGEAKGDVWSNEYFKMSIANRRFGCTCVNHL